MEYVFFQAIISFTSIIILLNAYWAFSFVSFQTFECSAKFNSSNCIFSLWHIKKSWNVFFQCWGFFHQFWSNIGKKFAEFFNKVLRQKKVVLLFPKIDWVKNYYHSPTCIVKCVLEYIFLISKYKQTIKKTRIQKKQKKLKKKTKYLQQID